MAQTSVIRGMLGGVALAALLAGPALAQKPPAPPANGDRLAGNWVFSGRSEQGCVVAHMMAGMVIAPEAGGEWRVTSRRALRLTAPRRGCPPVADTEKLEELQGAARIQGDLVAIVLRGRDGRVHTLGYRLAGDTLAALCTDCIERTAPWRRTGAAPPGR